MAAELGACGAYLVVGQLLRRSGLIHDSDTQARSTLGLQSCSSHNGASPHHTKCRGCLMQVAGKITQYATLPSLVLVALQRAPFDARAAGTAVAAGLAGVALTAAISW